MAAVAEDKCRIHVAGDKADLYFHTDELHGSVVTDGINGHRGIPADLAFHPVEEAFIKPFHGSDRARPALGGLIAVKRRRPYASVEGQVIFPDKVPEDAVELLQGMDRIHVQPVYKPFLCGPPKALLLAFGCPVPWAVMDQGRPDGSADQGELLVGIGGAIVDHEFGRNVIRGDGVLENLLEPRGVVVIEKLRADDHAGVVVDDADGIDPAAFPVLRDVREIARIRLIPIS